MIDSIKIYLKELIGLFRKGIGGKSDVIKLAVPTSAGAYTAADCVGGVITLDGIDVANKTAIIQNIFVRDLAGQAADLTILLFDRHPVTVGGATCTDAAAFAFGSSMPYLIGSVSVATADYITIDGETILNIDNIGKVVKTLSDGPIYLVVVCTGTPTYGLSAAGTVLTLVVGILKD